MKDDKNKLQLGLIYKSIMDAIAQVRMYGVKKYGNSEDWRNTKDKTKKYFDALFRHIFAANEFIRNNLQGEECDLESGLDHLFHAACNIMFLIEDKATKHKKERKNEG